MPCQSIHVWGDKMEIYHHGEIIKNETANRQSTNQLSPA